MINNHYTRADLLRDLGLSGFGAALGFLYYKVILYFGGALFATGHGSPVFAIGAISPFGFGLYLWLAIGGMLAFSRHIYVRVLIVGFLLANYLGFFLGVPLSVWELSNVAHSFKAGPLFAIIASTFYFGGQIMLWKIILLKHKMK